MFIFHALYCGLNFNIFIYSPEWLKQLLFLLQVLLNRWRDTHHCLWNNGCSQHQKLRQSSQCTLVSIRFRTLFKLFPTTKFKLEFCVWKKYIIIKCSSCYYWSLTHRKKEGKNTLLCMTDHFSVLLIFCLFL